VNYRMGRKRQDPTTTWGAKILEITSYPPPRAGWGVRVSFLRRWMEEKGHVCDVINIGKSRKVRSVEYVDVQGGLDYLVKVVRLVCRAHVVHTHINGDGNKGWVLALAAGIIAKLLGRECALTFHAGPLQRFFPRVRSRLCIPVFWLAFRLARVIICNSASVKERIREYGVRSTKIHAIPAFSRQYLAYSPVSLLPEVEAFLAAREPILAVYFFLRPEFFVESLVHAVSGSPA